MTGRARTCEEMLFAASLEPCGPCGAIGLGPAALSAEGSAWTLRAACARCRAPRTFTYATSDDPRTTRAGRFDLGPGASEILAPDRLRAVLAEAPREAPRDPALARRARVGIARALTAANELAALVPSERGAIEPVAARLWSLLAEIAPARTIDPERLARKTSAAHQEARLVVADRSLADEIHGEVDLSSAGLARCELTNTGFAGATFDDSDLEDVAFVCADLRGASLDRARVKGGSFVRADLRGATLREIDARGTDWSRADLDGASLVGARLANVRFDGARLGGAVLDRAEIVGASLRDASLVAPDPARPPTSAGARLVDCDFTGADWTGRDLGKTTFVRCKLAGVRGKPASLADVVLEGCDLVLEDLAPPPRTLAQLLADVFSLYRPEAGPFPAEVRKKLERRGRRVTLAGPNLDIPAWGLAAGGAEDVFVELEPDHECAGVRISDRARLDSTEVEVSVRDLPLADVEKVIGATRETPRVPYGPRRTFAMKTIAGRNVSFHASVRDGRVFALAFGLPREAAPIALTPETTPIATLEEGGERFEARRYPQDGVVDVVRYAKDGTILEKKTFTWSSQYMLRHAKLVHVGGDGFVLEVDGEHWKGGTPFEESFPFERG